MMFLLILSYCIVLVATIIFLFYYWKRICWWFGSNKPQVRLESSVNHSLAILIPARNEGRTVLPLIASLMNQTYASNNFDIYMVVKEAEDPTIGMVKEVLPTVKFFVDTEQKTKGHALDYGLKQISASMKGKYEAYIIIDADCLLDENFLFEMNRALVSGKDVYNSKLVVKNYLYKVKKSQSWAACCNGLIWTLMSELGNRAKSDHGITTMTLGTGLMIRAKLIEEWNGWPFQETLTEDIELQRTCALHHYTTEYVSYAVCYVEEATSLRMSNIRRQRWMSGVVHCDRLYDEKLKQQMHTSSDKLNFYAIHSLYYLYRYVGFLCVIFLFGLCGGSILHFYNLMISLGFFLLSVLAFVLVYLGMLSMTIRCLVVDAAYIKISFLKKLWIAITHPIYYMGYIGIMTKCFILKQKTSWKTIQRIEIDKANLFEAKEI